MGGDGKPFQRSKHGGRDPPAHEGDGRVLGSDAEGVSPLSLERKIAAVLLIVLLLPVGLVLATILNPASFSERERTLQALQEATTSGEEVLGAGLEVLSGDAELLQRSADLQLLSSMTTHKPPRLFEDLLASGGALLLQTLESRELGGRTVYAELSLRSASGEELLRGVSNGTVAWLVDLTTLNPFAIDPAEIAVTQALEANPGRFLLLTEPFEDRLVIGDPGASHKVLVGGTGLLSSTGAWVGTVIVRVRLSWLEEESGVAGIETLSRRTLLNESGALLWQSQDTARPAPDTEAFEVAMVAAREAPSDLVASGDLLVGYARAGVDPANPDAFLLLVVAAPFARGPSALFWGALAVVLVASAAALGSAAIILRHEHTRPVRRLAAASAERLGLAHLPASLSALLPVLEPQLRSTAAEEVGRDAELVADLLIHDVGNYAQGALSRSELLLHSRHLTAQDRRNLAASLESLGAAAELIKHGRTLLHLQAGGPERVVPIDLGELLAHSLIRAQALHLGKRAKVENRIPAGTHFFLGNGLAEELFTNLLSNAFGHDPSETPHVELDIRAVEESGIPYWKIDIADHGPGIPVERKGRLFDRFAPRQEGEGRTLGLYLVRRLVERYHGRVWAEDRVLGKPTLGARFVVLLPRYGPAASAG